MENKKQNRLLALAKKTAIVFSASITALTGVNFKTLPSNTVNLNQGKTIEYSKDKKVKPMPVLKLNVNNPENSKYIASHRSHSSHSSHSSHYSHRSASMFS